MAWKDPGTHHDRLATLISLDSEIRSGELRYEFVLSQAGPRKNASDGLAEAVERRRASTTILGDDRHKEPHGFAMLLDDKRLAGRNQLSRAIPKLPHSY